MKYHASATQFGKKSSTVSTLNPLKNRVSLMVNRVQIDLHHLVLLLISPNELNISIFDLMTFR